MVADWNQRLATLPRAPRHPVAEKIEPVSGGLAYRRSFGWITYPAIQPMETFKDDPDDPECEEQERPASWWQAAYRGFEMKVLLNPKGGEDREEKVAFSAYIRGEMKEEDYLQVLAYRVVEWKYREIMEDGTKVDIEPPATGGWDRFYDLPAGLLAWVLMEIRQAHLPKSMIPIGRPSGKRAGNGDSTITTPRALDPALDPMPAPESSERPPDSA